MASMKATLKGDFKKAMGAATQAARIAATQGMRKTTGDLKARLREQVVGAGLGQGVAKSIRSADFPKGTTVSLHPAGQITFTSQIIRGFDEGSLIRARGGRLLAIPTKECPRGAKRRRLSPKEAIARFGTPSIFKATSGKVVMAFNVVAAKSGRGFRKASAGRARQGRQSALVVFYILVPQVKLQKKLEVAGAIRAAQSALKPNIAASWPNNIDRL